MNIRVLAPRLEGFALASSEALTKGCLIIGVDPALENDITGLKARLVTGIYLNNGDTGVMIAEGLAKRLNISLQDTVVLIGQGYHGATAAGKYPVKGVLRFGSPQLNDKLLYMPLPVAQEFFSAQQFITSYVLSLHSDNDLNQTAKQVSKQIGDQYEVMTWEELLPDIKQHIQTDSNNMKVVQGVLYLLIFFGIFSTQINPAAIIMISLITSLPAPVK
jgi:ABC-type lipoprotein release transport system permease subunit